MRFNRHKIPPVIKQLEKRLPTIRGCSDFDYKFSLDIINKFRSNPDYKMSDKQRNRVQSYVDKYAKPKPKIDKSPRSRYGINCRKRLY